MSTVETLSPADQQYYCRLTDAGAALEAAAHAEAKPVRLTHVAVGDGGGIVPVPEASATALVSEVYRREIDGRNRDEEDPNIAWLHIIIPADVGGFWIREFGIYAEPLTEGGEPVLYAYGNHAPYYKLLKVNGQASTHELSIPIILTGTAEVEIAVKEVGYASQLALENLEKRLWENDGKGSLLLPSILPEGVLTTSRLLPGGGLALDADGQVFVDVDSMNEQRFEALLKALRVQKWLSGPLNIYVNQQTGSDTLDEGRGLSASKPFKTIQACVDYITSNYNVTNYNATIQVADGIYDPVVLKNFSRTSGSIILKGSNNTIIKQTDLGVAINIIGGLYNISNLKLQWEINASGLTVNSGNYCGGILCSGGEAWCSGLEVSMIQTGTYTSNFLQNCRAYHALTGAILNIGFSQKQNSISANFADSNTSHFNVVAICATGGKVSIRAVYNNDYNSVILCSGAYYAFARAASKGEIEKLIDGVKSVTFSGTTSGKRYEATTGGFINTYNAGPEYFPGDAAGTVDASTYSWYK